MKKWIGLLLTIALAGLIFWSCSEDKTTEPVDQAEIISDNTVIINTSTAAELESGSNETGNFIFTDGADLSKVTVGSIIVGGSSDIMPEGYLRKVTSKTVAKGKIIIESEQAALTDAIEKCSFTQTISLDTVTIDSVWYADGVKSLNDKSKFGTSINVIFFDNDGNYSTTSDQIKLSGSIQLNPKLTLDFDIDDWQLKRFKIALEVTKEMNALAVIGAAKDLNIAEWKIATFYMGTITIPTPLLGFPVVVTPTFEIYAKADGTISANAKFGIVSTETNNAGAVYENSQWSQINEHTENFTYNNLECNGNIELKAGIGAKLLTKFYGVFGPYMSAEGYGKITGSSHIDLEQLVVDYSLKAGLDAKIGLLMKIYSHVIIDANMSYNLFELLLKQDEFTIPTSFVFVQGGTFQMGCSLNDGLDVELPVHNIRLQDYYIGKYEVTQKEWTSLMGINPLLVELDLGIGDSYPIYSVNWYQVISYCNLRSIAEGLSPCYMINNSTNPSFWGDNYLGWDEVICNWSNNGYRLPTEAEWEYAARGGVNWNDNYRYSGCNTETELYDYAWFNEDYMLGTTHLVGTRLPNQLNIYDMCGNVEEMCWDWYGDTYYQYCYDIGILDNPYGPTNGTYRTIRGGDYASYAWSLRVSDRGSLPPAGFGVNGFRLARTP